MADTHRGKEQKKKQHVKVPHGKDPHGPHGDKPHGHKPHDPPYFVPDEGSGDHHHHEPPANPRYPDSRIYGEYASKKPPLYVPHPIEHTCFKPRKEDYKPPVTCDDHDPDDDLCNRKDSRALTADEQSRF